MSTITLAEAQSQLTAWLAASQAIATGQEYWISGRRMKRADAGEVRRQINYWSSMVTALTNNAAGMPTISYSLAEFK